MHLNIYFIDDFSPPVSQTGRLCPAAPGSGTEMGLLLRDRAALPQPVLLSPLERPQRHPRSHGDAAKAALPPGLPRRSPSDHKPSSGSTGEQRRSPASDSPPGHPRATGIPPEPRTAPERGGTPSPAPGPPLPPARPLPLPAARAPGGLRCAAAPGLGRGAERRLPGRGESAVTAAAVTARAAPAGEPAAAQRRASPAGRARGRQEGGEARQEPARRPVPCRALARPQRLPPQRGEPAVPGASCLLLPRAGIAEQRAAGPAPLHPAPSRRSFVTPTAPSGGRWVFSPPFPPLGALLRLLPPPPVTPPAATRAVSWTALPGSANRRRAPSPARPSEVRSRQPPARPRVADAPAAPERGRRGAGELPIRPLPARGAGLLIPQGWRGGTRTAPDGCSAQSLQRVGKEGWGARRVVEPGLRHRHPGPGQPLHPLSKTLPAQQRSPQPLLKCFRLMSRGWPVASSSREDGWITPSPKITLRRLSVQSLIPTAP